MSEASRLARLRHDLANPLSALLAEVQLVLMNEADLPVELVASLRNIEAQAIRMRALLLAS